MQEFLNNPVDISNDFQLLENDFFVPGKVKSFDAEKGEGILEWNYHRWTMDWFFNKIDKHLQKQEEKNAPFQDYEVHPLCAFSISFISDSTLRLRMKTTGTPQADHDSLMLQKDPGEKKGWPINQLDDKKILYTSPNGSVALNLDNWQFSIYDNKGRLLTATQTPEELKAMHSKAVPFSFMKRSSDYSRSIAASFTLFPGERIVGGGESFTGLDKRGQKMVLYTVDAQSTASAQQYKPIPFFFSNRGYGIFVHTSSPVTLDLGHTHGGCNSIYIGEDQLDLFIFIGSPAGILAEYTALTGRSPLPPLWSFGLWMSRFSYRSQEEVMSIAKQMRENKVPCDVIHIDAGWFSKGINCDFEFDKDRFPSPEVMTSELHAEGFRTSLWQIPYFTPLNPVFSEVVQKKLYVRDGNGNIPTEDAILDLSNSATIDWYREKIKALLEKGISVIKADFGEAAPLQAYYASGRSGFYEHNLYPLRYNALLSTISREVRGESIIWARSAWAGSQRYPIHWGGDAEVSDAGMAGTLRGGLSLGLSGFSFWSHDMGGFSGSPREELFNRWSFFGLLSSHSRVHGFPPREPWEFSIDFKSSFRRMVELRYMLMPYLYTQAAACSLAGLPMLKALLINYPDDPTAWTIEDQYLLGNDLLVAPIMESNTDSRMVYLPQGRWVNYFSGRQYEGGNWEHMKTGEVPGILLVRWGSLVPHLPLAQSTAFMNWKEVYFIAFGIEKAEGKFFHNGIIADVEAWTKDKNWLFKDPETSYPVYGFEENRYK